MTRLFILAVSVLAFSVSAQTPQPAPNFNGNPVFSVSTKILEKKAIKKVKPIVPAGVKASGVVRVRVWIDANEGKVIDAKVVDGNANLYECALKAARQWEWPPANIDGSGWPIVAGILNFYFPKSKDDPIDHKNVSLQPTTN